MALPQIRRRHDPFPTAITSAEPSNPMIGTIFGPFNYHEAAEPLAGPVLEIKFDSRNRYAGFNLEVRHRQVPLDASKKSHYRSC
jgi:hypothetical protein